MKLLSEKKKVYLLLLRTVFYFITIIIAATFVNRADTDFLARNIPYQVIEFVLIAFVYFFVATINKKFKLASIFIILKASIRFIINITVVCYPQILFINPTVITILESIVPILEFPFAYFFYKGFSTLVLEKTNNTVLANKWEKLLTDNIILAVLNIIFYLINFYDVISNIPQVWVVVLLLSLAIMVYAFYIGVLEIIYILRTAKELAK